MRFIAQDVREWMARLGVRSLTESSARMNLSGTEQGDQSLESARRRRACCCIGRPSRKVVIYCRSEQDHGLERTLDHQKLLAICQPALESSSQFAGIADSQYGPCNRHLAGR